jgi:hypothetical protein
MTQALYAHMNNKTIKKFKKKVNLCQIYLTYLINEEISKML